jgi:transcriptional regulator with XRE-family HTH domain
MKNNNLLTEFGAQVRKERLKQNLSQEELATKADVHRTYIGMVERAEKNITLKTIKKIADALNVEISHFF